MHKSVVVACESFWIASQGTKIMAVTHANSACLGMCMEFCVPVVIDCWVMGFGQRFWCSRFECLLLLLIPLGEMMWVA